MVTVGLTTILGDYLKIKYKFNSHLVDKSELVSQCNFKSPVS